MLDVSIPLSRDSLCNLFNAHPLEAVEYDVSIPLSRDSLCNRVVAEALGTNGYNRLFF